MKIKKISKIVQASPVEAPVKAPVETPTKTPTQVPTEKPRTPFTPPKPKVTPKPKAKKETFAKKLEKAFKTAAYQDQAHRSVVDFWQNIPEDHPFSKHDVLKQHGHGLSEEGHNYITDKISATNEAIPRDLRQVGPKVLGIINEIGRLEASHEDKLIEAAKDVTASIWGIDKSQLDGQIGDQSETHPDSEGGSPEEESVDVDDMLRGEINKRITMNTLTQGAAVHGMLTAHHLIAEKINQISPRLLSLYSKLAQLTTHHYYIIDIPAIIQAYKARLGQSALGWSHVEFPPEQVGGANDGEQPAPIVKASGVCFPVLCQEMFKGAMELISLHGINQNLDERQLKTVYEHSDRLEDEPWLITIGPALWRKFLKAIPKGMNLPEVVMKFSQKPPQETERIIKEVIRNPEEAQKLLQSA